MCRNGYRISKRIWWIRMSNHNNTIPALLMNYQCSREQKWNRVWVSIVFFTHFPKDRNCDMCLRTKITRAACRRRTGTVVPKAENFSDVITADHKILSEGCESLHNHRHAVVVQDLATEWLQSYPRETETSQETHKSLMKFLELSRKPKVIYTDSSLEFGKSCEELSWNHCGSTPHRSETNGIAERESSAQSKGRHLCCIVAIRSEWKLVGRFHGMQYLSAKHSRSLV